MSIETEDIPLPSAPVKITLGAKPKYKCRILRRPHWYINNVGGLYNTNIPDQQIPLKSSHLDAKIHNSSVKILYSQIYTNKETSPLEIVYKFPIDSYFSVTGVHLKLDDKEIEAVILEKEEAKEKYDDVVASGNTAAKINYDENIPEILELAIGQLQAKKSLKVTVEMVCKCDITMLGFYSFIFPLNFIPRYASSSSAKAPKTGGKYIQGKFSADIDLEASSEIENLCVSHSSITIEKDPSGKKVSLKLPESGATQARDIVVSYSTEEIRKPQITLHQSDKHPDEVVAHITCIPRISDEPNLSEDDEEEKKEEAKEPAVVTKIENTDDPDIASGEFIFILDRSGSMRAHDRLTLAKDALKLFIKSLPDDSIFNIIGFGTKLDIMHKKGSIKYSKDSVNEALLKIELMGSDLGGTALIDPLEFVFRTPVDLKYPRNIFVLTDGAIRDTDPVMKIVKENNHSARVHSFGIGNGASKYLVKELSKVGLGTCQLIADQDSKIKGKVIQALNQASKPALTDIKVDWGENNAALNFQTPRAPVFGFIYEEEILDCYAVFSKSELMEGDVNISFYNTFDQDMSIFTLRLDPSTIIDDGVNDFVFKLAAKENMNHLERLIIHDLTSQDDSIGDKSVEEIILYNSLKYSVLSKKTAFFGKIKNKDKSGEEMKTIEIPITRMVNKIPSNMIRKGMKRGPPDMCLMAMPMMACAKGAAKRCKGKPAKMLKKSKKESKVHKDEQRTRRARDKVEELDDALGEELDACLEDEDDDSEEEVKLCAPPATVPKSDSKPSPSLKSYEIVIQYQEPEGYFTKLPDAYSSPSLSEVPSEVEALAKDADDIQKIWITILALVLLEKKFKKGKQEWVMIAKKARKFLKKNMTEVPDIEGFFCHFE
ncbi:unnamed protein product [Moneuplotes crassus]|uniref:Uncharacterized protein n=2 Tax=Euplotes crassus TaxID=5936 RepID=A0AAD2D8R0_EUPCR|nr:unnamed protein product [Moneuplotes crassus]